VRHSTTSKDPRISYAAAGDSPKLPFATRAAAVRAYLHAELLQTKRA
jgi:hypothetical protein